MNFSKKQKTSVQSYIISSSFGQEQRNFVAKFSSPNGSNFSEKINIRHQKVLFGHEFVFSISPKSNNWRQILKSIFRRRWICFGDKI